MCLGAVVMLHDNLFSCSHDSMAAWAWAFLTVVGAAGVVGALALREAPLAVEGADLLPALPSISDLVSYFLSIFYVLEYFLMDSVVFPSTAIGLESNLTFLMPGQVGLLCYRYRIHSFIN